MLRFIGSVRAVEAEPPAVMLGPSSTRWAAFGASSTIRGDQPRDDALKEFKACLVSDTKTFAVDFTKPYCNSVPGNASTVDLGSLVMRAFPIAGFFMQDITGFNNIVGGKITLTAPPGDPFVQSASDGGANDLSLPLDGKIVFRANRPGTYTWCENAAPTGYLLTSPKCGTINLTWDLSTGITLHHAKARPAP